jgi:hypothetical protein
MKIRLFKSNLSKTNLIITSVIILLLNSCATNHNGFLSSNNDLRNIKYVDFAFGNSKTTTFLGIGGNKHDALVLEAKLNMMRNFPLKSNQFYGNFIVDYKTTKALGVITNLVTVSADILEEKTSGEQELFSESLKSKLGISKENDFFNIGDTVVDVQNLEYTVASSNSEILILYPIDNDEKRFSKMEKMEDEVFSTKKYINDENNKTQYNPGNSFFDGGFTHTIIGVNKQMLLLKNERSSVYFTRPIQSKSTQKKVITFD